MRDIILLISISLSFIVTTYTQSIILDEQYDDWSHPDIIVYQESGDAGNSLDIESLSIADDVSFVYFRIEFDREIQLQEDNRLVLTIKNRDVNLQFRLGERFGFLNNERVFHNHLGLISSPTVTSDIFEIQLRKDWLTESSAYTLEGKIEVSISNLTTNGDALPDNSETIEYFLEDISQTEIIPYSFERQTGTDIRLCSYNVERDNIFDRGAQTEFTSILKTISADVYVLQEIYDYNASQTLELLQDDLQVLDNSGNWEAKKRGSDNIIISKWPIVYSREVAGNGVFVIDREGQEILVINVHFPCCDNDDEREIEIDALLSFIREAKKGTGNLFLEDNTPIIIAGDTNFVGFANQVSAILDGNIFNNNNYGPDFEIDWDSDGLRDSKTFATGTNALTTWRDDQASFSPGRLDYIFYSDATLDILNTFALDTRHLSGSELTENNLESNFTSSASDHFPIVADIKLNKPSSATDISFNLPAIYPNPSSDIIHIPHTEYATPTCIYDSNGHACITEIEQSLDISSWTPGMYFIEYAMDTGSNKFLRFFIAR